MNSPSDLSSDFFFSLKSGKPVAGDFYFALSTFRDGLDAPAYLEIASGASAMLIESASLTASGHFRLLFPGQNAVLIATNDSKQFWTADLSARRVKLGDRSAATKFQILTNAKKDTVMLRTGDFFVRCSRGAVDDVAALSPMLVGRSLFKSWKAASGSTSTSIRTVRQAIDSQILAERRQALSARGGNISLINDSLSAAWLAYDLALALPVKKPISSLTLAGRATGLELALLLDQTVNLMTQAPLLDDYTKLYPNASSFGKDLVRDFDLLSLMDKIPVEGPEVWRQAADAMDTVRSSGSSKLRVAVRSLVWSNVIVQDFDQGKKRFGFTDVVVNLQDHLRASCDLAWLLVSNKKNTSSSASVLQQRLEVVRLPILRANSTLLYGTTSPENVEDFWFTPLLQQNVSDLTLSSSQIFPELALLKLLKPEWVAEHSWIAEGVTHVVIDQVDALTKSYDVDGIARFLDEPQTQTIVEAAEALCTASMVISFCAIPSIKSTVRAAQTFLMASNAAEGVLDLRDQADLNLQKYNALVKSELQTTELVDTILTTKDEMVTLTNQLADELVDTIDDAGIQSLLSTNQQLRKNALALYDQAKNSSSFKVQTQQALVDQQTVSVQAKYKAASDVRTEYLSNMKELAQAALTATIVDTFFAVVETAVAFADGAQTLFKPSLGGVVGSASDAVAKVTALQTQVKTLEGARDLKKTLEQAIPQLEELVNQLGASLPQLAKLRDATAPLLAQGSNETADLASRIEAFNEVYASAQMLNVSTSLGQVETLFDDLTTQFCVLIHRTAFTPCVKIQKLNQEYFGNMQEAVQASDEVLSSLSTLSSSASSIATAQSSRDELLNGLNESQSTVASLKAAWGNDAVKRKQWLYKARKQQNTNAALSSYLSVRSQASYLTSMYQLCARLTYSNGGTPVDGCESKVFQLKRLDENDLNKLLAFESDSQPQVEVTEVLIPTVPEYAGDTAYLDLKTLMSDQSVAFALPQDFEWLSKYGWVNEESDLDAAVVYLKKLTLLLPPRFADFKEEVTITFETRGMTDLGSSLARHRYYRVPAARFQTRYTTGICQDDKEESPYAACGTKLSSLCIEKEGTTNVRDNGLQAGLFSEFQVTATFASATSAKRIGYRSMASPLLLRARIETAIVSRGASRSKRDSEAAKPTKKPQESDVDEATRSLRRAEAAATGSCCPSGQYAVNWSASTPKCVACPSGSVSQLHGLFCLYNLQTSAATTRP